MKNVALLLKPLLITALLTLLACSGAADLKSLGRATPQEEYQAFLKSKITAGKAIDMKTLSAGLIVKALPYTENVETRARLLFQGDPRFSRETSEWKRGASFLVLMGLFAPDLGEKDVTETGRFRPRLKSPDGLILNAAEIKRYGRDSVFIRDHFPVFDPWEEVFLVKFNPAPYFGKFSAASELILEWPGGVQLLPLNETQTLK